MSRKETDDMGNIDWLPIEELPESLKTRPLLLWDGEFAFVGTWSVKDPDYDGDRNTPIFYCGAEGHLVGMTHFAEINPPAGDW